MAAYNPGLGHEKACRLTNTIHSEIAPCLPLPSVPIFCGAVDQELRLFDEHSSNSSFSSRSLDRNEVLDQASKIADLLHHTDVSYLNLKDRASSISAYSSNPSRLQYEVLQYNSEAFQCCIPGIIKERHCSSSGSEQRPVERNKHTLDHRRDYEKTPNRHSNVNLLNDAQVSVSSRKSKVKRKGNADVSLPTNKDPIEQQDRIIDRFCKAVEDLCGREEALNEDQDEADTQPLSSDDLKNLVKEIMSIRTKKILHLVPVDILVGLLNVLDRQIRGAEGLSIGNNEGLNPNALSLVVCAMESTHAALAVMTNRDMPKQLYKEEIVDRILDFSRHQVMETMLACDPSYRALHRPDENGAFDGEEDDELDAEFGSAGKKRSNGRSVKARRSTGNKIPAAVNASLQKLCTILGFLKDLLLIERLSDSFIFQLVKTSFETFLVENVQILQLKAISLISAIFSSYTQHRNYLIDETVQMLWKLPFSKRAMRAYYLPDEEQRQIQMITALLIQLVQCSTNIPETLRQTLVGNSILEVSVDASYPVKCNEAATEACCQFWARILQRLATVKPQDVSEIKMIIENLVMDLLTTLNLPEYPASALILEVLCVLLLQNAGLKSKEASTRNLAIDLLGTVAARLKYDSVVCHKDKFWITQDLVNADNADSCFSKDACSVCLEGKSGKMLFICHGCQRAFHTECMGVTDRDPPSRGWFCQFCICQKQLSVLQSYCMSQSKDDSNKSKAKNGSSSITSESITKVEIVQQLLLDYLQGADSSDDTNIFVRWFYLCLWYKDDPRSQEKFIYYLARLKSKTIVQDFGTVSSVLKRESAKKISLSLVTINSFSRGFDKILCLLLASLRENSPVLRTKAIRAVSLIVEADPEVLSDKRVQSAVEGRFCDSSISVREAALELVGRHIASHPDVCLKYFEKVAERVKDTGVSVRKRAIKIIRDMCTSSPNFSQFTSACIEIISRVSDDESSVQDLVCKTFYEFWFEEPTESQTQFVGDGSSVPLEVAKKTEQVVEMLRKMTNHQPLVTVIKRNLALDFFPQSAKAIGINPVFLASVRKRCELMCKCLLERMLQVEEANDEELEVCALPYVLVLHAFCVVDPTLCAPSSDPSQFLVTLQPYLKNQGDNPSVARLLESVIFVIDVVLPLLRKPPQYVSEELEQDLKHMIVRHSFLTVVHACIKCLCSLSKLAGKGSTLLENLILLFLKRLDAVKADNKQSATTQQTGRSLFCLGLLIRYGNELMMTSNRRNVLVDKSLSLITSYLCCEDFVIKVRSLQALGFVLIARPEYMLETGIQKILEATLSSGSDFRLKVQSLQNIYEYLLDAESHMGADNAGSTIQHPEEGGRSVPVAAGAGDTNICGGILQLYWNGILGRSLDMNEQVRQASLKIVEVALRQGLVHPITCVPYLIALETDPQEANSKLAHHLLTNMNEKYPSFFESRLGDGLQLSFSFIQSMTSPSVEHSSPHKASGNIKGKSDVSSFSRARLGVSRIYRLIRGNRVSRNKFMSSVVRKFDSPGSDPLLIPFLMYCTEILASLPFTSPDEPLYLIYTINRLVQVKAGNLRDTMKTLSSCSFEDSSNKTIRENGTFLPESALQASSDKIINNGSNSRTSVDSHQISKDDLQAIQTHCHAAMALQLLLKLKRHLKIIFGLDDARCQAYSPTELLKTGEVLSKQNIPYSVTETRDSLPTSYKDVIERYQEFKKVLDEDTLDYSTYTASIKRKRPPKNSRDGSPPKNSRGGRITREAPPRGYYNEEDDEDWTDGNQSLSTSGRKSSSRVRQRLQ